ncbi:AAA family ATPase [Candidatus Roizmanbacteria bacterium]|nr:AAA family ATPase [Candidatus Roizmanbacteria bacterium]
MSSSEHNLARQEGSNQLSLSSGETTEFIEEENVPPLPINGLLYPVDLEDRRVVDAFKLVVRKVITAAEGVPARIETASVEEAITKHLYPRILISFETDQLSTDQLTQLEDVARRAYGDDVKTTRTKQGKTAATHLYPKPEARGKEKPTLDTTIGWYFGTESGIPNRTYKGLFVYRKIGKKDIASGVKAREDGDWFTQETLYDNSGTPYHGGSYLVEIREGGMFTGSNGKVIDGPYQTDLAETIVYTSLVLAGKELPPSKPGLTYDIYHEMNQVGLGVATELPGLENQIKLVERALIIPLASPDLTLALKGNSKSVGLVGQVGTGKTQIIKHFLRRRLGVMMVPVNAGDFEHELTRKPESRTILPRIRAVADKVGRSVVLVIEDLEHLANADNPNSKLLLNELAGLYNSGYRVLWTTNQPEVFNPQLTEPERLGGKVIFCGLPNSEARKMILEQHLVKESRRRKLPVFDPAVISDSVSSSEGARDLILRAVAASTHGFTPRFLKDIVIESINHFMYRIASEEGHVDGLQEYHLVNQSFLPGDWIHALQEIMNVYDVRARLQEDERLQKLINPGIEGRKGNMGFTPDKTLGLPMATIAQYGLIMQSENTDMTSEDPGVKPF